MARKRCFSTIEDARRTDFYKTSSVALLYTICTQNDSLIVVITSTMNAMSDGMQVQCNEAMTGSRVTYGGKIHKIYQLI